MVDEGKEPVVEEVQPDEAGKLPETIPLSKYIGIKEAWGKSKEKVASLEEQVKKAVSTEEHGKVVTELEETKTKLQTTSDELKTNKDATLSEKRATLIKGGISEEDAKGMSEEQINGAIKVLASYKPKPDLGGGGGASVPQGAPMELARRAYTK